MRKFNIVSRTWKGVGITLDIWLELDMQKRQASEGQAQELEKELVTVQKGRSRRNVYISNFRLKQGLRLDF